MKIAITGVSGYIGAALARHCIEHGLDVTACSRDTAASRVVELPDRVTRVHSPDGSLPVQALDGCEVIVHLAGRAHNFSKPGNERDLFDEGNHLLAVKALESAISAGVRRFVQVSTVSVHGNWSAQPVNESSPLVASTPYAVSKMAAESALEARCKEAGMELCIVRPPLVYGCGCPGNFSRLVRLIQSGLPLPLASVTARRSFIHVDNLVDFLRTCSEATQPDPIMRFVIGDGSDWLMPDLVRSVARELGMASRLTPFPLALLRLAALVIGRRKEIDSITRSLLVDWARARSTYGWSPVIDPAEAFIRTMACFRGLA